MIYKALELLRRNLQDYLREHLPSKEEEVALKNIAVYDSADNKPDYEKTLISLVNLQEEFALKNNALYRKKNLNGTIDYQNPPVFFNLYILICANQKEYSQALACLSAVGRFFQSKNTFTISNSFDPSWEEEGTKVLEFTAEEEAEFKLNLELFSLTFEQINHLWGSLGGKQVPFILYKGSLVKIEDNIKVKGGGLIEEVVLNAR